MSVIIPAYFGYFNSQRGLLASQAGLNVINHNIANANTPGYSRQRIDLVSAQPYASPNMGVDGKTGQLGQGVNVQALTRLKDIYLDQQFRVANQSSGMQETLSQILNVMETLNNEPNTPNISEAMSEFFKEAQSLATNPENIAVRTQFLSRAESMLSSFKDLATQLQVQRTNLVGDTNSPATIGSSQLAANVTDVNTKINQIAALNDSILKVTASGGFPNDLMDQRDQIIDDLSHLMNITVDYKPNNMVEVRFGNTLLVQTNKVINTFNVVANPGPVPLPDDVPSLIQLSSTGATVNNNFTGGVIAGILQMGNNTTTPLSIRGFIGQLDSIFDRIATTINTLQAGGRDYNGAIPAAANSTIFNLAAGPTLSIFRYSVNGNLKADPRLIAAADGAGPFAGVGDGRNALAMAALETTGQAVAPFNGLTFSGFYNTVVAKLGVDSAAAQSAFKNASNSVDGLEQRRQSVQGVNVEEEMVNLLRFQRAFEASSKAFKTIDESVQTLMSLVQ